MEGKNNFEVIRQPEIKSSYYERKDRPARELLVQAVSFCEEKKQALDLGAGDLAESKFLLENGFTHVTAVDKSPQSKKIGEELNISGLDFENESFNNFEFAKNKYNLINAQFSLPFYDGENFSDFMKKIIDSLKPNGIFTGHLFGIKDDHYWGKDSNPKVSYHTKEEVVAMFQDLEKLEFRETEEDGKLRSGEPKHWHVFSFIVKKKD
ncbi:MAG: methyltransferase type 12 [uncultured bacterium]|nr:MAG: methyltransferase type 12 [uncultured bacterium]